MIGSNFEPNKPYDVIIIVRASYKTSEFASNAEELMETLRKIGDSGIETK